MKIIAFDTEDNSKGKCFLYDFYDPEIHEHYTFKTQDDALDFVFTKTGYTFWACNLEYDLNNLFRDIHGLLHYCYAGSRLLSAELKEDKIKFYDTLNHWPMSVKKMGDRINLPKLEMKHTGSTRVSKKMIEYCRRDTEITGKFVRAMSQIYHKENIELKMTIASSTLAHFEENYLYKIEHNFTQEQIDFFHRGYYGGRTEIFHNKPVTGKIWYHDINSLYPSVMKDNLYPKLEGFYETTNPNLDLSGMAYVDVEAPTTLSIPYLPFKHEGKLVFPLGRFQSVYTYFELREAQNLGYKIHRVFRAIEFDQDFDPFSRFVAETYEKRRVAQSSKDELMQITFKNLLNYSYGKYAQKNESTKLIPLKDTTLKGGDVILGDLIFRKEKIKYPRYANCVWACYVTAYARHKLFKALTQVEKEGALLLYCDTDSVIYENPTSLIRDSKELGEFKTENNGEPFRYAHFKLPKLYVLKTLANSTTYKTKGVPSQHAEEYFTTERIKYKKPNKLRETLRRNLSPKRTNKLIPNFWETRQKEITGKYNKRIVLKNGSTKPLIMK
ncbi:hypothetical protein C5B42_04465 [Candidatus Cerribacteria bacterium 'Amazon FNV 2010 28 9']|uniref:DNA-directed DNA polymerase n=1 Tax=Candidatus Cerribacteria bacterium 'Amazon FNV 2010 28 9' TaxID=2081795 RepID=A0A317JP63_9BACT|nr:MAG: hypothetical protein C5B42_04465 [Candidatus Cerribacteria bacterium 'Amazon FNV 2010 28 9']